MSTHPRGQWAFRSSKERIRRLIQGLLIAFFALLCLESGARVLFTFYAEPGEAGDELERLGLQFSAELGWERKPNFEGSLPREAGGYKRRFDGQDSSTFGWGAPPEFSYPQVLDRLIPDITVINLGVLGYSSFQGYKTLVKYAPILKPNLIIVAFNYNDRRYVLSPDDEDGDIRLRRIDAAQTVNAFTRRVYLVRVMRAVMWRSGIIAQPLSTRAELLGDVRKLQARVPPERYRENLRKFAEFGRRTGSPLIFVIMKDNPAYTDYLRQGIDLLNRAQYDLAGRKLEIAVNLDNAFSEIARKYLAVALEQQGAFEEGKHVARIGRPLFSAAGGRPIYLDVEHNEIMRSVAKEYDIEVVDAATALEADPSLYVDYCHPNRRGYEVIARLLDQPARRLLSGRRADRRNDMNVIKEDRR